MRSPLDRHGTSPALRFLRASLLRDLDAEAVEAWQGRLEAGGIVREIARARDLRRSLPWVARSLARAGIEPRLPADERALLTAARLSASERARRVKATLDPLGEACGRHGVAPLLLKGTALHGSLHPDPALRPVSDVDLCIRSADLSAMRRALTIAGLVPEPLTAARLEALGESGGHAFALSDFVFRRADGGGVPIELKLDPVQLALPLRRPDAFFEGATPSPTYPGFLVPAPEPMAVQQALHLARHDGSDLVWWAELAHGVARAAAGQGFDSARAVRLVDGEGLLGTVHAAFDAAEALFPGSLPRTARRGGRSAGATLGRFRARGRPCGPPDERAATHAIQAAHALGSGRPLETLAELGRRMWPSRGYLRARLGLATTAPIGARARGRRLLELFRRHEA